MLKTVVGLVTVLFVAGSAYAQEASHARLSPDDLKALTEARIAATKDILKLTPEQTRFWPPVENAIRARAEARHQLATDDLRLLGSNEANRQLPHACIVGGKPGHETL